MAAKGDKNTVTLDKLNELFVTFYRKVGVSGAFELMNKHMQKNNNEVIKEQAIIETCFEYDMERRDLFNECTRKLTQREGLITLYLVLKFFIPTCSVDNLMDISKLKYLRCWKIIRNAKDLNSTLVPDRKILDRVERIKVNIEMHLKELKQTKNK